MPLIRFRDAVPADIPALVALVESAYRGESSRAGWTTEADLLDGQRVDAEAVREAMTGERSVLLLAVSDVEEILACAHVAVHDGEGYFGMFAVRPTLQGGGIGSRLLAEAERRVREDWGCRRLAMMVIDVRDELIAWYERRGYVRSGTKTPFPYGDPRFGLPRRADLRFEWLYKDLDAADGQARTA